MKNEALMKALTMLFALLLQSHSYLLPLPYDLCEVTTYPTYGEKTRGNLHTVSFLLKGSLSPRSYCCFLVKSKETLSSLQPAFNQVFVLFSTSATGLRSGCQVKVIWIQIAVFTPSLLKSASFCPIICFVLFWAHSLV